MSEAPEENPSDDWYLKGAREQNVCVVLAQGQRREGNVFTTRDLGQLRRN
jgi:hypothetical protein